PYVGFDVTFARDVVPTILSTSYPTAAKIAPCSTVRERTGRRGSRVNNHMNSTVSAANASTIAMPPTSVPIPGMPSRWRPVTTAWVAAVTPEVNVSESTMPTPRPTSTTRSSSLALTKFSFVTSLAQIICTPVRRLPTQPSPAYATPSSAITPRLPRLSITDWTGSVRAFRTRPGTHS